MSHAVARPYMNVTIWEHTPERGVNMLALIVVSKKLNSISAIMPNSGGVSHDLTPAQFEEWHSFALFMGHEIDYLVCDDDYQERKRYCVKSRAMQAIA